MSKEVIYCQLKKYSFDYSPVPYIWGSHGAMPKWDNMQKSCFSYDKSAWATEVQTLRLRIEIVSAVRCGSLGKWSNRSEFN